MCPGHDGRTVQRKMEALWHMTYFAYFAYFATQPSAPLPTMKVTQKFSFHQLTDCNCLECSKERRV